MARLSVSALAFFVSLSVLSSALAQIEEFTVAEGTPEFGEQPLVSGSMVFWRRYGIFNPLQIKPPTIQCKDISRLDNRVIDAAQYSPSLGGVYATTDFLFRGALGDSTLPDASYVWAQRIEDIKNGRRDQTLVSNEGYVVGATRKHLILKLDTFGQKKFLAKEMSRLSDPSPEALRLVTEYRVEPEQSRTEKASEKYFVWEDRNPDIPGDSWKIYARRTEDLFTAGSERLVVDTKVYHQPLGRGGIYLDLYESNLVYEGARENSRDVQTEIYLLDMDSNAAPVSIASEQDELTVLTWPCVSAYYVVWTEDAYIERDDGSSGFRRTPFARRLFNGKPVGENFPITDGKSGGSWLALDRNIVAWNGSSALVGGQIVHGAIVAAELPLPGADDVGDVDQNGRITITDPIIILQYLFSGGGQPRRRPADADLSGSIGIEDAIFIIRYLFQGGPRPGRE